MFGCLPKDVIFVGGSGRDVWLRLFDCGNFAVWVWQIIYYIWMGGKWVSVYVFRIVVLGFVSYFSLQY